MIMHRAWCGYGLFVEHYEKYDDLMWNWPCLGLIPENGSAGGAGAGLIIPGVGWVRAVELSRWFGRGRRARRRSLARGCLRSGSGPGRDASLARIRCGALPHVVAQGRPDYLPAPLGAGPPGELRPRQYLVYPRGVSFGDLQPDGDPD